MKLFLVFLLGLLLRVAIIVTNPIIWGGDTIIRLFDRHTLSKGHQLPMLQVLISGVSMISMDPVLVQYLMALIGAVAGLGFYWLVSDLCGENWAFPAALLFITHPYVLAVSTVPFQEILMLAGLLFAFHFFYTESWWLASICLALACLTRYEAWVACPVLATAYVWQKDRTLRGALKAAVLYGWMPVAWILAHHGLTSTGHFVIERSLSIWRLQRYAYLGWITVKFTQLPVLMLAAAAAWRLYRDRSRIDWRWWILIAFVGLFLVAVPFSAHGVMPDPERYVTSREAYIPMCFVLLLAALGLTLWPRWRRVVVTLSMVMGVAEAFWYVRVESADRSVLLDYRVAQYLDHSVHGGEHVLILANTASGGMGRQYLEKAYETGGEEGLRQARVDLQSVADTPPDFRRVVVYSHLSRDRFLIPPATCGDWVAVWSDYPEAGRELAGTKPVEVIRYGSDAVNILRRDCH
jgi:hypothetical protein